RGDRVFAHGQRLGGRAADDLLGRDLYSCGREHAESLACTAWSLFCSRDTDRGGVRPRKVPGAFFWPRMIPPGALQLGLLVAIAICCVALWNQIFALRAAGHQIVSYEPRRIVP